MGQHKQRNAHLLILRTDEERVGVVVEDELAMFGHLPDLGEAHGLVDQHVSPGGQDGNLIAHQSVP